MKTKSAATLAALAIGLSALTTLAQDAPQPRRQGPPDGQGRNFPPDGQQRPGGRPDGQRPPGSPQDGEGRGFGGFRPPMHPIQQALDANNDGIIDEAEMKGAYAALKKLDKNNDGQITVEEMRPEGGMGRGGFGGGPGGPGGPDGQGRGGFGGPGGPGGAPGGGDFLARLMENDKNNDGKLTKDELPEPMQRILERADANGDGALDKAEIDAMAARFQQGAGGRGGVGGGQGGPGGPGRGGPGGQPGTPQRPPLE